MPGPTTEVLSDDLKEVRSDLHKVEVTLAAEIHKVEVTLVGEILRVDNTVGKLGAEFAVLKWLLGATLATTLSGVIGSAYWAGSLASRVTALEGRFDKFEGRLEHIEASIAKAIGRADGNREAGPGTR